MAGPVSPMRWAVLPARRTCPALLVMMMRGVDAHRSSPLLVCRYNAVRFRPAPFVCLRLLDRRCGDFRGRSSSAAGRALPTEEAVVAVAAGDPTHEQEPHAGGGPGRLNWLREGVLGANDGIVSVAGIVVGVKHRRHRRGLTTTGMDV